MDNTTESQAEPRPAVAPPHLDRIVEADVQGPPQKKERPVELARRALNQESWLHRQSP